MTRRVNLSKFKWLLLGIGIFLALACVIVLSSSVAFLFNALGQGTNANVSVHLLPVQRVAAPFGVYADAIWLADDTIVVNYGSDHDSNPGDWKLWQLRPNGTHMEMVKLPEDTDLCGHTWINSSVATADGRLAVVRECGLLHPKDDPTKKDALIWNPHDGSSQFIFNYDLPREGVVLALSPDLSRAVLATSWGLDDYFYRLDQQGAHRIDIGLARESEPVWSHDEQFIAFRGNQRMFGKAGPGWALVPQDLWIMLSDCVDNPASCSQSLQRLVPETVGATRIAWSPDDRWLIFDGDVQNRGGGIWMLNIDTRKLIQVLRGEYLLPTWSPDGKRVLMTGPAEGNTRVGSYENGSALYILDVSEIVNH